MLRLPWKSKRRQEAEREAWLAQTEEHRDRMLHLRVAALVGSALAVADSEADTDEAGTLTSAWWTWRSPGDVSAQRWEMPGVRTDWAIYVEVGNDPDAGPWVFTSSDWTDGLVRFMPGAGFDSPTAFLDWFHREVTPC